MKKNWIVVAFVLLILPLASIDAAAANGAIAVDRGNGFVYGFSHDYPTMREAERRALQECRSRGGRCSIVVRVQGRRCGAYATIDAGNGSAFGWSVADNQSAAMNRARRECRSRSNGHSCHNHVYMCNSR